MARALSGVPGDGEKRSIMKIKATIDINSLMVCCIDHNSAGSEAVMVALLNEHKAYETDECKCRCVLVAE